MRDDDYLSWTADELRAAIAEGERKLTSRNARQARYDAKPERVEARREEYLSRSFFVWDGEGVTPEPEKPQRYVLLAGMSGSDRRYHSTTAIQGLHTIDLFEYILRKGREYPKHIHVIYGGSYDFNMWSRNLPEETLIRLHETGSAYYGPYRIEWRQGKWYRVTDREARQTVTVYDVVSFFQRSFVEACELYMGENFPGRSLVEEGKATRSTFTLDDEKTLRRYNETELNLLLNLMVDLRERLDRVGIRVKSWHGPGAVASALLSKHGIREAMAVSPEPVAEASRYAYFGGRFEVVKFGHVPPSRWKYADSRCWQYDVNSAYPAALVNVPNLAKGEWVKVEGGLTPGSEHWHRFGVHHIRWNSDPDTIRLPLPLPVRSKRGHIYYPRECAGWYWTPELHSTHEWSETFEYAQAEDGCSYEVLESWVFVEDDETDRPFSWVADMYAQRLALKEAGDGAQIAVKLALNSLYGKLAQQVGWKPATDTQPLRIPTFHQLEWAGYVTSYCRAAVMRAALEDPCSVVAFETDAIFVNKERETLTVGPGLGDWERKEYAGLSYFQSGLYWTHNDNGTVRQAKTRGVDRGLMELDAIVRAWRDPLRKYEEPDPVPVRVTRFVTLGAALTLNSMARWRKWETSTREILPYPSYRSKRCHWVSAPNWPGWCRQHTYRYHCDHIFETYRGDGPVARAWSLNVWHETTPFPGLDAMSHSFAYPVEWVNPQPDMTELDELRRSPTDWTDDEYEVVSLFEKP